MMGTSSTDGASSESLEISPSSMGISSWVAGCDFDVPGCSLLVRWTNPPRKFCGAGAVNCQLAVYSSDCCGQFRISLAGLSSLRIISESLSFMSHLSRL